MLLEAQVKNNRDSSTDDEDLQSRTSEQTYLARKTWTVDRDYKKFLYHAPENDKSSASSEADSDNEVKMEGLAYMDKR
jgi:hypothetical protein